MKNKIEILYRIEREDGYGIFSIDRPNQEYYNIEDYEHGREISNRHNLLLTGINILFLNHTRKHLSAYTSKEIMFKYLMGQELQELLSKDCKIFKIKVIPCYINKEQAAFLSSNIIEKTDITNKIIKIL